MNEVSMATPSASIDEPGLFQFSDQHPEWLVARARFLKPSQKAPHIILRWLDCLIDSTRHTTPGVVVQSVASP